MTGHLFVRRQSELVLRRRLPRQSELRVGETRFVVGLTTQIGFEEPRVWIVEVLGKELIGDVIRLHRVTGCKEEPQLVAHDRAAGAGVDIVISLDRTRRSQPCVLEPLRQIAALERCGRRAEVERPSIRVAAFPRDVIDHNAANLTFDRGAGGVVDEFLGGDIVHGTLDAVALAAEAGDPHAALGNRLVLTPAAMGRKRVGNCRTAGPADVGGALRHGDAGKEDADVVSGPADRNQIENLPIHHPLLRHVLRIDDRTLAGNGNGVFQRPDRHLHVHGCSERPGQLNSRAVHGRESRQREPHHILTRWKIGDSVSSASVSHRRATLLDQDRTGDLDGDSR